MYNLIYFLLFWQWPCRHEWEFSHRTPGLITGISFQKCKKCTTLKRNPLRKLTMPLPKTVTAQDFIKALQRPSGYLIRNGEFFLGNIAIEEFEALLSRARQEARAEGRREGLKEMDWAWMDATAGFALSHPHFRADAEPVKNLRQEYQQRENP